MTEVVYFTGQFELDPKRYAQKLGMTIVPSVSNGVDWVVKGRGHSIARVNYANDLGLKIVDEKEFFHLIGSPDYEQRQAEEAAEAERQRAEWKKYRAERAEAEKARQEYLKTAPKSEPIKLFEGNTAAIFKDHCQVAVREDGAVFARRYRAYNRYKGWTPWERIEEMPKDISDEDAVEDLTTVRIPRD